LQATDIVAGIFEFVILIFSLSFHECAHAWMASRLGDQTARMQGRVTLNPQVHVDPIGTLLIPALMIFGSMFGFGQFLIGWAKPTPVITRNFKNIVRDDNLTTLAGPCSNLILALCGFLGLAAIRLLMQSVELAPGMLSRGIEGLATLCDLTILVNLALVLFNLLPIPPLDGSRVVRNMLPYNALHIYDEIGGWMGLILMISVGGPIVRALLDPAMDLVYSALDRI
jgi:Zn-dependent protease